MQAFSVLSRGLIAERPIPYQSIVEYSKTHSFSNFPLFEKVILAMELTYLDMQKVASG